MSAPREGVTLDTACDHCGDVLGKHRVGDSRCPSGGSYFYRSIFRDERELAGRLRMAADAIVLLNSMSGYDADAAQRAAVSPLYLRHEADEMEKP